VKFLKESLSFFLSGCLVFATTPGVLVAQNGPIRRTTSGSGRATDAGTAAATAAPIALYPDALVRRSSAAATYPDQVVEADDACSNIPILKANNLAKKSISSPGILV